ncbi:hypothetical protein ACEPPN_010922 [Leptodophora sp. 'Broadleaf-Isolate-01']
MDGLTPSQKAQLREVADLMLEIYRTLARMQYLDHSWIHEGPHNIASLLPVYHSHNLDPSIIYLYSVLPYVDTAGAQQVDFLQGGEFADFRQEGHVERGRDPFYADAEEEALRPWMTPLSLLGNHHSVILYDARKHCIGIFDQESGGSTDHNLWASAVPVEETSEAEKEDEESEAEEGGSGEEEGESDDGEDGDDDEDSEGGECIYDEMDARPARDVLRDIVQWYHDLVETPGGGEQSGEEWDVEIVKPLYIKHGWPHANFDGDDFLVDQARATAATRAKWTAEEPLREVQAIEGELGNDAGRLVQLQQMKDRLASAKTDDEDWLARWELWEAELINQRTLKRLAHAKKEMDRLCPDGQCQKPEELPLWEARQLREDYWSKQRALESLQQQAREVQDGERESEPGIKIRLHYARKQATVYQKALKAAQLDAERLCPGRSLPISVGVESSGLDLKARKKDLTRYIEDTQPEVKLIREWMAQLPDSAHQARQAAQNAVHKNEQYIETCMEQRRGVDLALEKYK